MPSIRPKTVLLIDGDVLVYQVGLAAETATHWGDDWWTLHADAQECKATLDQKVVALKKTLEADEVRFALSCSSLAGFRRALCPTYKSNRIDKRKPIVHNALRQHLLDAYDTILRDRLEADDVLGILATQPTDERRILVSIDKDFRGVPCMFYRTCDEFPQVITISSDEAARFHALQTLTGDRVDGYVGIPGCGPKSAEKILAGVPTADLWPAIVKAYDDAGLSESVALVTARLARILQSTDYNTKTGEITLWQPTQPRPLKTQANAVKPRPARTATVPPAKAASTSSPSTPSSASLASSKQER